MEAALWSAIAIVAALSTGTLFVVIAKIDALASRLDGRIDGFSTRIDGRIDGFSTRLDGLAGDTAAAPRLSRSASRTP